MSSVTSRGSKRSLCRTVKDVKKRYVEMRKRQRRRDKQTPLFCPPLLVSYRTPARVLECFCPSRYAHCSFRLRAFRILRPPRRKILSMFCCFAIARPKISRHRALRTIEMPKWPTPSSTASTRGNHVCCSSHTFRRATSNLVRHAVVVEVSVQVRNFVFNILVALGLFVEFEITKPSFPALSKRTNGVEPI